MTPVHVQLTKLHLLPFAPLLPIAPPPLLIPPPPIHVSPPTHFSPPTNSSATALRSPSPTSSPVTFLPPSRASHPLLGIHSGAKSAILPLKRNISAPVVKGRIRFTKDPELSDSSSSDSSNQVSTDEEDVEADEKKKEEINAKRRSRYAENKKNKIPKLSTNPASIRSRVRYYNKNMSTPVNLAAVERSNDLTNDCSIFPKVSIEKSLNQASQFQKFIYDACLKLRGHLLLKKIIKDRPEN